MRGMRYRRFFAFPSTAGLVVTLAAGVSSAKPVSGGIDPAPTAAAVSTADQSSGADSSRVYRLIAVVGGATFAATYIGSLVVAASFHDEGASKTERRRVGYLAWPVAGPFLATAAMPEGAPVFVPIGALQALGAVAFVVGATHAATASARSSATPAVRATAGVDGAALSASWRF